jgi:hypothetical protein
MAGSHPRRKTLLAFAVVATTPLWGCRDVDSYALGPGQTYCGTLVYTPVFTSGLVPSDKEPPTLGLRLDLDVNNLTTVPGTLTTNDAKDGICSAQGKALFEKAELRTIVEALKDPISVAQIGEGRDQSFWTYVSSSCGHEMMAVVSLMHSGGIEVRLFKPAAKASQNTPAADAPGFGLFTLERKSIEDCGF